MAVDELAIGWTESTDRALGGRSLVIEIAGHGARRESADERDVHLGRGERRRAARLVFVCTSRAGVIVRRRSPVAFAFVGVADCLQGGWVGRRRLERPLIRITRGWPLSGPGL